PRPACADLRSVRFSVNPALAARLPLEVLDHVGHVDLPAIDAGLLERGVEQPPGRTDERVAGEILGVARLLADQHHLGLARSFPEHGLRAALVEIAGLAPGGDLPYRAQRGPVGQQLADRNAGPRLGGARFP